MGGVIDKSPKVTRPSESVNLNGLNPSSIFLGEQSIFVLADGFLWSAGEGAQGRLVMGWKNGLGSYFPHYAEKSQIFPHFQNKEIIAL